MLNNSPSIMNDGDTLHEENSVVRTDGIKSSSLLQLADIINQNILLHPFIALRRTCQVNRKCSPFICVQPFSLIPFLYHQQRKQGIAALYRGLSSELLVKGITLGAETAIINYTDWPREVSQKRLFKDSLKVLALRGLSVAISTPFLCAAVKETIQSVIIVRDRPSFVDCLKDGFFRFIHLRSIPSARMLPIWLLVVPTVLYHVSHSIIWQITTKCLEALRSNKIFDFSSRRTRRRTTRNYPNASRIVLDEESTWQQDELTYDVNETILDSDKIETDSNKISNSIIACLFADVALLPVETVLNSLYIQGTRTIIDNVDETTVVLPVLTNFDGFSDCYQSILKFEGNFGLYKGLGAIVLQYSIHYLSFRVIYYLLKEFQTSYKVVSPPRPRRPLRPPPSEYKRFLENNRHSTPSNPNEPKPHFDSMLLQDTIIGGERVSTPKLDFMHNRVGFASSDI
jgi:solute carrier family 25 protein 46